MAEDSPIGASPNASRSARDFKSISRTFRSFLDDFIAAVTTSSGDFASQCELAKAVHSQLFEVF